MSWHQMSDEQRRHWYQTREHAERVARAGEVQFVGRVYEADEEYPEREYRGRVWEGEVTLLVPVEGEADIEQLAGSFYASGALVDRVVATMLNRGQLVQRRRGTQSKSRDSDACWGDARVTVEGKLATCKLSLCILLDDDDFAAPPAPPAPPSNVSVAEDDAEVWWVCQRGVPLIGPGSKAKMERELASARNVVQKRWYKFHFITADGQAFRKGLHVAAKGREPAGLWPRDFRSHYMTFGYSTLQFAQEYAAASGRNIECPDLTEPQLMAMEGCNAPQAAPPAPPPPAPRRESETRNRTPRKPDQGLLF